MRSFVAIEIDPKVRRRLAEAQRKIRYVNAKIGWVAPQNFHLTLKFLGETTEDQRDAVQSVLQTAAQEFEPIEMEMRGLGQFPRVIWAGMLGEIKGLARMARRLDDELAKLGFAREAREFKAHLTLGRIKRIGDREGLTKAIASFRDETFGAVRVDAVHLFQSTLTPNGSIYTKLFTVPLKGADHGHKN